MSDELVHTAANGRSQRARAQPFEGRSSSEKKESMDQIAAEFQWEDRHSERWNTGNI